MATSLSVIVLRSKEPNVPRPYKVTGFPVPTLLFCAVCGYLIYSAVVYAVVYKPWVPAIALGIALAGLPIYWLSKFWPGGRTEETGPQRGQNP
jgi:amino acid transporter